MHRMSHGTLPRSTLFGIGLLIVIALVAFAVVPVGTAEDSSADSVQFTVDGINYETTSDTEVKVIRDSYSGSVIIPASVTYSGNVYSVTSIGQYAFDECTSLTSVTLGNSVTSIGIDAFYKCTSLTSVTLGNSVTSIGSSAFSRCTSLVSVIIPNSVTSIGNSAFSGCTSLRTVTMGNCVTTIGNAAFYDCETLTSITIPNSVTSIGNSAFYDCFCLVEVCNDSSLPITKGSNDYGWVAFYAHNVYSSDSGSSKLHYQILDDSSVAVYYQDDSGTYLMRIDDMKNTVTLPETLGGGSYSIYKYAFSGCTSLTSLTIVSGVTSIGIYTFDMCTALTSVTLGNDITSIGWYAFYYCTSLTSISIPDSVTSINCNSFYCCKSLTEINVSEDNNDYCSVDGVLFNKGLTILVIYPAGKASDTYSIPNSVLRIGDFSFSECASLTSVVIPNSVTYIGSDAFSGCTSLTSVVIPNSVTSIGSYAFYECTSLTSVVIPNSVSSIDSSTFSGCTSLASVVIPNSVTSISGGAFANCISLTSVTIPNNVKIIGRSAFFHCESLASVNIGSGVTSIGEEAFAGCIPLISVTIPNSVTSIGSNAFNGCYHLVEVCNDSSLSITKRSSDYGRVAFYALRVYSSDSGISNIHYQTLGDSSTAVYYQDNSNTYLVKINDMKSTVTLPDTLGGRSYGINQYAFYGCTSLISVITSDNITSIGDYAFYGCSSLTSMTIPSGVKSIDAQAFYECYHLVEVCNDSSLTVKKGSDSCGGVARYALNVYSSDSGSSNLHYQTLGDSSVAVYYQGDSDTYLVAINDMKSSVILPDTLGGESYIINKYAFKACKSLTSVTIPNGVTLIGHEAFYSCTSLTTVINNSLLKMTKGSTDQGYIAYYADTVIGQVLDYSVGNIEGKYNDNSKIADVTGYNGAPTSLVLDKVTVGDIDYDIVQIGKAAFLDCTSIISVKVGSSITSIGDNAFRGCYYLVEVCNDSSLTMTKGSMDNGHVAYYALNIYSSDSGSSKLHYQTFDDSSKVLYCQDDSGTYLVKIDDMKSTVVLPDTLGGGSYCINKYAFYGCMTIVSLTVSSGVTSIGDDAFKGCYHLVEVCNDSSLSMVKLSAANGYVAYYALNIYSSDSGCSKLHYQTLDDSSKVLYYQDVSGTYLVKIDDMKSTVVLPDVLGGGSYGINQYAFYGCSTIASLTIGNGITSIGDYAFYNCKSITSLIIPGNVTSIGEYAFWGCKSIASLIIYDGVLSIGPHSFQSCGSIDSLIIPKSVTYIGYSAFHECRSLTSVTIGRGVTSIGQDAFLNCSITSVINNSLLNIKKGSTSCGNVAYNADNVTGQVLSYSVDDIKGKYNDHSLVANVTGYNGAPTSLVLDRVTIGDIEYEIIWIGYEAFKKCTTLTSVTIGSNVMSIGDYAFYGCESMTSLILSDSVISIGDKAFCNCKSITSLNIPDSVISVGYNAFSGCSSLSSVSISDGLTTLDTCVFSGCSSLINVVIPDGITTIGLSAFSDCTSLISVTIPSSVTSIEYEAFFRCVSIIEVCNDSSLPIEKGSEDYGRIAYYALNIYSSDSGSSILRYQTLDDSSTAVYYQDDSGIYLVKIKDMKSTVILPDTLGGGSYNIYTYAFIYSTSITSVTIPSSIISIGDNAFAGCTSLATVINNSLLSITKGLSNYGHVAEYADNIIGNVINYYVDSVLVRYNDNSMIAGVADYCDMTLSLVLDKVIINDVQYTIVQIDSGALKDCTSLTSVTIGNGITSIGDDAFSGCYSLVEVCNDSSLPITKGSEDYGKVAYYALNVYSSDSGSSKLHYQTSEYSSTAVYYQDDSNTYLVKIEDMLSTIILPDALGDGSYGIYQYAFYNWGSLKSVITSNNVTSIGNSAFKGCTSLSSVFIPDSVTSIGYGAFEGCTALTSVMILDGVTSIGDNAFSGCRFYDSDGSSEITDYSQLPGYAYRGQSSSALIRFDIFDIQFDENGGSEPTSAMKNIICGDDIVLPGYFGVYTGHHFAGWAYGDDIYSPGDTYSDVSSDMTFTAVWDPNIYHVVFMNGDSVYRDVQYEYGAVISLPEADPQKQSTVQYDYAFDHWERYTEGMTVSCDMTFNAVFTVTVREYTVKFISDGINVKSETLAYGSAIVEPDKDPVKGSTAKYDYAFDHWNGYTKGMTVIGDMTFNAVFTVTVREYTVKFVSEGIEIKSEKLEYDSTIFRPATDPTKESTVYHDYAFDHWDGFTEGMTVSGDMIFDAVFKESVRLYTVKFVSEGIEIKSETLTYGSPIVRPVIDPIKESTVENCYIFDHWDGYAESMTVLGNMAFNAVFIESAREYIVKFVSDGIEVKSEKLTYGSSIVRPDKIPTKESTPENDYAFDHWDGYTEGMTVSGDMTFNALFTETVREYTVKFVSDGIEVKSETLNYGSPIVIPDKNPIKKSTDKYDYAFDHWDGYTEGMTVLGNMVFNAVFNESVREYTVKFVSDGIEVKSETLNFGSPIVRPDKDPSKKSTENYDYAFDHWDGYTEGMTVTGDINFKAVFIETERLYKISFLNNDDVFYTYNAAYDTVISSPDTVPTKPSDNTCDYRFVSWAGYSDGIKVTGEMSFKAQFESVLKDVDTSGSTVVIDTKTESNVKVPSTVIDSIRSAGKDGKSTDIKMSNGKISIDSASAAGLPEGEHTISFTESDRTKIPSSVAEKIGNRPVYSISIGDIHEFDGTLMISVRYDLQDGEKAEDVCIWYLKDNGTYEKIPCTYSDGYATFMTTHLSDYAVMVESEPELSPASSDNGGGMDTGLIIGIAVAAIVVIALIAVFVIKGKKGSAGQ